MGVYENFNDCAIVVITIGFDILIDYKDYERDSSKVILF